MINRLSHFFLIKDNCQRKFRSRQRNAKTSSDQFMRTGEEEYHVSTVITLLSQTRA